MTTLMMDKPKGGRGHTAPYETKQMRVPTGLESQIQELISRYRDWISEAGTQIAGTNSPPLLLDKSFNSSTQEPVDKLKGEIGSLTKLVDNLKTGNAILIEERNALEIEVNQLHAQNGELNLEILELKEQIKPVDKLNSIAIDLDTKPVDKLTETIVDLDSQPVDKLIEAAIDLDTKPVDKLVNLKLEPMGQRQLAKRLEVAHVTVGRHQEKEDFISWSQGLDPDQVGWRFDPKSPKSKQFHPVNC